MNSYEVVFGDEENGIVFDTQVVAEGTEHALCAGRLEAWRELPPELAREVDSDDTPYSVMLSN